MSSDLITVLAMRHAAGGGRGALARELRESSGPGALAKLAMDPRWRVDDFSLRIARRQLGVLRVFDIDVVPQWSLPERLLRADPPVALFVRGNRQLLERPGVAIVGCRRAHPSSRAWAFQQAVAAVEQGLPVHSGGALGVDTAAHQGALAAGGQTVVYLGVPIDRSYPAGNRGLFARVLQNGGAIISEHPPGAHTPAWEHAQRNRFIAAQATLVLLAEAGETSGALGTTKWAHRLGIEVAVSPPGVGCTRLGIDRLLLGGRARVKR